jgi:hypothetical protein
MIEFRARRPRPETESFIRAADMHVGCGHFKAAIANIGPIDE